MNDLDNLFKVLGGGAIVGALVGFLSSFLLARHQHRVAQEAKILEEFFSVRRALCSVLAKLANLEMDGPLDEADLAEKRAELSRIYFSHFDLLPADVLRELTCLYACLKDTNHRLYGCSGDLLRPLSKEEIIETVDRYSILRNFRIYARLFLLGEEHIKGGFEISINLQARKVLLTLNNYFNLDNLMYPAATLRKPLARKLRRTWWKISLAPRVPR